MAVDGHLNCFQFEASMNNAAMHICVQVCVYNQKWNCWVIWLFCGGTCWTSIVTAPFITFPLAAHEGSNFSTSSRTLVITALFDYSHHSGKVVPCCGFVFPWWLIKCIVFLHVLLVYLLLEKSVEIWRFSWLHSVHQIFIRAIRVTVLSCSVPSS